MIRNKEIFQIISIFIIFVVLSMFVVLPILFPVSSSHTTSNTITTSTFQGSSMINYFANRCEIYYFFGCMLSYTSNISLFYQYYSVYAYTAYNIYYNSVYYSSLYYWIILLYIKLTINAGEISSAKITFQQPNQYFVVTYDPTVSFYRTNLDTP